MAFVYILYLDPLYSFIFAFIALICNSWLLKSTNGVSTQEVFNCIHFPFMHLICVPTSTVDLQLFHAFQREHCLPDDPTVCNVSSCYAKKENNKILFYAPSYVLSKIHKKKSVYRNPAPRQ